MFGNDSQIIDLIMLKVLNQMPKSYGLRLDDVEIFEMGDDYIVLGSEDEVLTLNLLNYTQGFKEGSFAIQYVVEDESETILWQGQVFIDPTEENRESRFQKYRKVKLMNSLENLDVIINTELNAELSKAEIEDYLRHKMSRIKNEEILYLSELDYDLMFEDFKGHRLSEIFKICVNGIYLYGFVQELSKGGCEGQSSEVIYELYAGLRRGLMYPINEENAIKGVFHQAGKNGLIWIWRREQKLLEEMQTVFELAEWVDERCFQEASEEDLLYEVVRDGDEMCVLLKQHQAKHGRKEVEEAISMIAEIEDVLEGELELATETWEAVLNSIEANEYWFILERHGMQPFCGCLLSEIKDMIFKNKKLNLNYRRHLFVDETVLIPEIEEIGAEYVQHHYELTPELQIRPLKIERAIDVMEDVRNCLLETYKISYKDSTYMDETI